MGNCSKCGKKIGLLSNSKVCQEEDCLKEYCSDCKATEIKECEKCDGSYCKDHIKNHECEEEEEGQEDITFEDIEKEILNFNEKQLLQYQVLTQLMDNYQYEYSDLDLIEDIKQGRITK